MSTPEIRAEISNRAVDATILLNSGACLALLAFLQEVWVDIPQLVPPTILGLCLFSIGAALGVLSYHLRLATAHDRKWETCSYRTQFAGLVVFAVASLALAGWATCIYVHLPPNTIAPQSGDTTRGHNG